MRRLLLLLCLACLTGCAASAYNLAEAPPKAGLKGYQTLVNTKRLSPPRALEFYADAGAAEAAASQDAAIQAYRGGKRWWLTDLAIGAATGAVLGAVLVLRSDPNAPGNNSYSQGQTVVGWALVGVGLAAPIGALHAWLIKRDSQAGFRKAVDAYNARQAGAQLP